jgi:hypothetical protein
MLSVFLAFDQVLRWQFIRYNSWAGPVEAVLQGKIQGVMGAHPFGRFAVDDNAPHVARRSAASPGVCREFHVTAAAETADSFFVE